MDRSRVLVAAAMALYLLSMVERIPAFVPAVSEPLSPPVSMLRGGVGLAAERPGAAGAAAGSSSALPVWGLRSAAALLTLGAAVAAAGDRAAARQRSAISKTRIQRCADDSMLRPSGAIIVYTKALLDGAAKKGESVPVTKDIMKLKAAYADEEFLDKMHAAINEPYLQPLEKVAIIMECCPPMESTVVPAFLRFLAKKQRLISMKKILKEYVQNIYYNQSIIPVRCYSASPLTDAQKEAITQKMKKKLNCTDVKLMCETDLSLLGGFKLEYGYTDPDTCRFCSDGVDVTLRNFLDKSAVKQGVLVGDY